MIFSRSWLGLGLPAYEKIVPICFQHIPEFTFMAAEVRHDPDKRTYIVSNERIEATGFKPSISLDEGIEEYLHSPGAIGVKVLVISAAFPPFRAGEATNALYLCRHLADRKLDVHVLTSQSNTAIDDPRITIHPIMHHWSWLEILRFGTFVKRCSPDVVLLMYIGFIYNDHPMITFAPTISKTLLPSVPFVTRIENTFGSLPHRCPILTRFLRKGFKLWAGAKDVDYEFGTLLRDSDHLIVLSDDHRAKLAKLFPAVSSKSVLIPPPPNMRICPENDGAARQRGREMLGVKPDDFLMVYLGYIYAGKGIETLLKAFQIVSRQRSNLRLIVVGGILADEYPDRPSYAQEMHELADQLGIDDKVTWTGYYAWDSDEASVYLRAADACVLPFDYGVHLNNSSFAAAAAHGLPIITTRGAMLEQPFVHQENIFLCPPKNPEAIATAVETLMDSPELRECLRAGARDLALEWFSWDRNIERTIATFS